MMNCIINMLGVYSDPIQAGSSIVVMCIVVWGYIKATQHFGSPHINLSHTWDIRSDQYTCVIHIVNLGSAAFIVGETIRVTAVDPQGELLDIKLVTEQTELTVKPGDSRDIEYRVNVEAIKFFSGFHCYEINVTNSRETLIDKTYILCDFQLPIPLWQYKIGRLLARANPWLMIKWVDYLLNKRS